MYFGQVKVASCAMTGFDCTKSCSWLYQPVQVNHDFYHDFLGEVATAMSLSALFKMR